MGSTLEAPQGSDRAKLDVTPVAGGGWSPREPLWLVAGGPPGNQRDSKEGQFLKAKGEGLLLEKRKRG